MSIANIFLILVIVGIAVFIIMQFIKSKKTAEVVQQVDVDEKTYTLDLEKIKEFIEKTSNEIIKELKKYY